MLLKSLELQGFKTFPDKTKLSFEEGITSVVGPNGSGKSNISDAMRWVLGEQSVRVLRCAKMEDVIFSGTPKRKAQGYAEITLNIENKDRELPFDNDNVAITRRYYRSGESEYMINRSTVRLKDINELFMDTGLGRDGYSIIGQGKIDSIVGAKSEDRREIFEEASGISRFRYRKEESERRLRKTEDNLIRLRDILSELEQRVEPLKIQAEKAEKFIEFDAEKKSLEIGIWTKTLSNSMNFLREQGEKIQIAENQLNQAEKSLENISESMENSTHEMNRLNAEMDKHRADATQLDEQAVRTEGEISVLENDSKHESENILRLKKQIELTAVSENEIEEEIASKKNQISLKIADVEETRKRLDSFTEKLAVLRAKTDELTAKVEAGSLNAGQISEQISDEQIRLSSAKSSAEEVANRAGTVDEILQKNAENLEVLESEVSEISTLIKENESKTEQTQNAVKGHELRVNSRRQKLENVKAELEKITLDAKEQERKARLLSDLEKNLEGFAQSVKAVVKESERGLLKGVYGPVTKLIRAEKEYATALETALGAAMQNVVVETENDAKSAIRFLKQKNIGRATFLPRTIIKGKSVSTADIKNIAGFVGVAADLCSCDLLFQGIKDSLLGRVIVAEDLNSAVQIAKTIQYRYRVVSLDGQVVNAGGSLTGGSSVRNSGLLSRNSEIERVALKAKELRNQAELLQDDYQKKQFDFANCKSELESAKVEQISLHEEQIKLSAELARVQREFSQAKEEIENLKKEKENASERLFQLNKTAESAQAKIGQLEIERAEVQRDVESFVKERAEALERAEDINAGIQEIKLREMSALKDKETIEVAISELEQRIMQSGNMATALHEEVKISENKIAEIALIISEKLTECESLKENAQSKRVLVAEILNKRAELERSLSDLRQDEKTLLAEKSAVAQELARLAERRDNSQNEHESIVKKLWDEYELTPREAEENGAEIENLQTAKIRLGELKNSIKALGSVNVGAVVEYKEVSERYEFLSEQVKDVETSKTDLLKLIGDLTQQMQEQFTVRFAEINRHFGQIFKELFGGGSALLSFTDENDVLNSGIDIKVHPPGKIVTHIESLSGGEKALVAISIYFAIMKVSPPPFCVLDEIEAALDDVNVARFAGYLRRMSTNTQFITITHRRGTMEGSDMLYGVTMQDQGISKLLALKTDEERESFSETV